MSHLKQFRGLTEGRLTLEHNDAPQDLAVQTAQSTGDPFRNAKLHNHHMMAYDPPSSQPSHHKQPIKGDTKQTYGRKTQFYSSGMANDVGHGMLVYGSDPAGKSVEYSPAVTLRERTSADIVARRRQQEEADRDIAQWRQRKAAEQQNRNEEKRKDLELLRGYVPWGKPGAGAPLKGCNGTVQAQRGKLLEEPMEPPSPQGFFSLFGKPGAGAPNRTTSGRVKAAFVHDHSTRFQSTMKRDVEHRYRYAKGHDCITDYARSLDSQVKLQAEQQARNKEWELERDTETIHYDPYGRPGGGAPNRNDTGGVITSLKNSLSSESSKSLEEKKRYSQRLDRQIQEKARSRKESMGLEVDYNPWGKGTGVPQRDPSGNIRRYRYSEKNVIREFSPIDESGNQLMFGKAGGGAPILDIQGRPRAHLQNTLKDEVAFDVSGSRHGESDEYFQFGRPGGGAPVKDQNGKLAAKRGMGPQRQEKLRNSQEQKEYLDSLRYDIEVKRDRDRQQKEEDLRQSNEFARLVEQGKIGQPKRDPFTGNMLRKQPKTGSDVTSLRFDVRRPDREEAMEYYSDLNKQVETRQKHQEKPTEVNPSESNTQLPWERSVEKDQRQQKNYGRELNEMMREKEDKKFLESNERLTDEQMHVDSYNGMWGRPGAGAPRRDAKGKIVAHRNYRTLQEDSHRTEPVRL
ncbi:uncharacterized protein LOC134194847 [Corticium candelabrum]|uniref:uncharacterized protein LOC134194847 n=1 Tax=Corticium candelabrum TaxID=121492 RepID=UPI002E2765BC|nr:uncharacterized protein LOC134194847 [Corticium candelabrum]